MVHVPSHSRQRQNVVTVMVFASVSMILPLQNGQLVGRVTASLGRVSVILVVLRDRLAGANMLVACRVGVNGCEWPAAAPRHASHVFRA